MHRLFQFMTSLFLGLTVYAAAASEPLSSTIGVVNFTTCVTDSKYGKQEQASFESLKKQMTSLLEDTDKQLNDVAGKLNDKEYLDGLTPEAEKELREKFERLSEELNRYQNQYYQVLNQANMKIVQSIGSSINSASEKVAKDKHFSIILNKEACFFISSALDVTTLVINEMDKAFEQDAKKQPATPNPSSKTGNKSK